MMQVKINDNSNQKNWDDFVIKNSTDFGLLQSWQWGLFQETLGRKIFRLTVEEGGKVLALAQVIKQPLKLGLSYFYLPRGPIIADTAWSADGQKQVLEMLFTQIRSLAGGERVIFLRLDPAWQDNETLRHILDESGLQPSGQVQPKQTLILSLAQSEAELLKAMKPKTRYNIRLAEKAGVVVKQGDNYFTDFWRLTRQTAQRQEIVPHADNYYRQLLSVLGKTGTIKLLVAEYRGQVIAANLVARFGDWSVYLHGASDYDQRDKMAPYLLQWESMVQARQAGCRYYDFWGTDAAKWPGITRFKTGFAPRQKPTGYIGAWDEAYNRLGYNVYRLIKNVK